MTGTPPALPKRTVEGWNPTNRETFPAAKGLWGDSSRKPTSNLLSRKSRSLLGGTPHETAISLLEALRSIHQSHSAMILSKS
jgi:hypothetical protein